MEATLRLKRPFSLPRYRPEEGAGLSSLDPAHCRRKREGATQFPTIGLFERNANNFKGTRNTKAQKSWSPRDCGRDAHYWAPPAQNRTCGFPAYGSHLGCLTAGLAAFRTRSGVCDTLSRHCVRHVRHRLAFSLAPALRSTASAAGRPALFGGFVATMAESDFSCPCIIGFGSSPSRCGPVGSAACGRT